MLALAARRGRSIESLHDVAIVDTEQLPRDALLGLCAFHGLKTTHKNEYGEGKKKSKVETKAESESVELPLKILQCLPVLASSVCPVALCVKSPAMQQLCGEEKTDEHTHEIATVMNGYYIVIVCVCIKYYKYITCTVIYAKSQIE